ncbi:MAG: hypothetical protein ABSE07_06100 [Methanoregula sp.]|jgi:hypothetical protein
MKETIKKFSLVFLFLFLFSLGAGCASTPSSNTTTTNTAVPGSGPAYVAGDIVKIPTSTTQTAWLIIRYDASTDMYERALIYPNADGSWGYRMNSNSVESSRTVIDRDYTKITNKAVLSIPVQTPTIPATTGTVTTTVTVTATGTTVPTGARPTIKNIVPDVGTAGTTFSITELTGTNFKSGATVALVKSGNPNITATNVNVQSLTLLTCTLSPPSDAVAGSWDVVVTNPDGQYGVYTNLFSIHNTATVTTTVASTGGIGITSIDPTFVASSGYYPITVYGSNFQNGITAKLTKSGNSDIIAGTIARTDTTQMRCFFNIPTLSQGTWSLVLTNTDGTTGTLENAFDVRS